MLSATVVSVESRDPEPVTPVARYMSSFNRKHTFRTINFYLKIIQLVRENLNNNFDM